MTNGPKLPQARSPALLPDREEPYVLRDVYERMIEGCRGELVLQWDNGFLSFRADGDTDSLEAEYHEGILAPSGNYRSLRSYTPWSEYLGKNCGWTWLAVDQEGYWDGALLSFDDIIPNVLLNVSASSIGVFSIVQREGEAATAAKRP
jgi:hypothetical protein